MRRLFWIILAFVLTAGLVGCRKARFEVKVELPEEEWGNYHVSYYASDKGDGGLWVETTLPLEKGKATFTGSTINPTLLYFSDNRGHEAVFYVDRGDNLTLTGENTDPTQWQVKGNRLNEQWWEYRRQNAASESEGHKKVEDFVKNNPDEQLSALLLLTEYPRNEYPEEFVRLWNSLGEKSGRSRMSALVPSGDISGDSPVRIGVDGKARYDQAKVKVRSLALRRAGGAVDTVVSAEVPAGILYFYRRDGKSHYEIRDTLRALSKAFPDSAARMIAMVSFDTDSVNWQSQLRNDSVSRILTAWMPLGTADRQAMRLGVSSTPFMIVVSGDEKQLYRGSDITEAAKAFRNGMKKAPEKSTEK